MTRVLLHYDGDGEWTYIDHEHVPDPEDGDDVEHRFVIDVPEALLATLTRAEKAERAARAAIFALVGFDSQDGCYEKVCPEWVGTSSGEREPHYDVLYRTDRDRPPRMGWAATEAEAQALIDALPEQFVMSPGFGPPLRTYDRARLYVEKQPPFGPWHSRCHRCGNARDDHKPVHNGTTEGDSAGRRDDGREPANTVLSGGPE